MELATKIWVLGMLVASRMSLLLGPLKKAFQIKKIRMCMLLHI